jgi:hypothetical protein
MVALVEAEGMGESEVLGRTPEGQAETPGAAEVEVVARQHPAAAGRMGRAAELGALLGAGLEEQGLAALVRPARLLAVVAVAERPAAAAAREATGRSKSHGINRKKGPTAHP